MVKRWGEVKIGDRFGMLLREEVADRCADDLHIKIEEKYSNSLGFEKVDETLFLEMNK